MPDFEIVGPPGAPVVVVLGGISASRHVTATPDNPVPGWWNDLVGVGRAIDTTRWRVLGIEYLDGGRRDDGFPERIVTTHDQAAALAAVLDAVEAPSIHAIVGASYGGMVALAFAERFAARIAPHGRLVVISAPHQPHPMSTALRSIQRQIVQLGVDVGRPVPALAVARALAMTTYRSAREFAQRFDPAPATLTANAAVFPVEEYLCHHGKRFAATWSAERFLALSLSGDLHGVDPARITTPTLVVAAEGDAVVPEEQLRQLVATLGGPARLMRLLSLRGHDAFLTEPRRLGRILTVALSTSILADHSHRSMRNLS